MPHFAVSDLGLYCLPNCHIYRMLCINGLNTHTYTHNLLLSTFPKSLNILYTINRDQTFRDAFTIYMEKLLDGWQLVWTMTDQMPYSVVSDLGLLCSKATFYIFNLRREFTHNAKAYFLGKIRKNSGKILGKITG